MIISGVILIGIVVLLWKEFKVFAFDPEFAQTIGLPVKWLNVLLSLLIVVAIIIGLQTVGVILMSAMLIAPAVAARQWVNRLSHMVILSSIFGAISGVLGSYISSTSTHLPTGPIIVVCITCITAFSLLFAPHRGIVHRLFQRRQNKIEFEKARRAM